VKPRSLDRIRHVPNAMFVLAAIATLIVFVLAPFLWP
jgi:hypothetical protein